jgi:hypothetical protein
MVAFVAAGTRSGVEDSAAFDPAVETNTASRTDMTGWMSLFLPGPRHLFRARPSLSEDRISTSHQSEPAMSVEFIGYITNNNSSETIVRSGPVLDRRYIETVAKAHEIAGFDRALLAFHSTIPDGLQVGQHVLNVTDRLHVMIAQRPGFTAPTLLARQLATIDQLYEGRVSNGPARSPFPITANIIRFKTASRRSSPIAAKAFQFLSAAHPMPRSRSRASMPIRLRCGANPTRRCAM